MTKLTSTLLENTIFYIYIIFWMFQGIKKFEYIQIPVNVLFQAQYKKFLNVHCKKIWKSMISYILKRETA